VLEKDNKYGSFIDFAMFNWALFPSQIYGSYPDRSVKSLFAGDISSPFFSLCSSLIFINITPCLAVLNFDLDWCCFTPEMIKKAAEAKLKIKTV
jgi:hypothetical protein